MCVCVCKYVVRHCVCIYIYVMCTLHCLVLGNVYMYAVVYAYIMWTLYVCSISVLCNYIQLDNDVIGQ